MNILLIDNYDSFTYNLVHCFHEAGIEDLEVLKNDQISVQEAQKFDKIVISPGPGIPAQNGNILDIIRELGGAIPILGICLGMQAIYEAYGGRLMNLQKVFHGVTSRVSILDRNDPILKGIPNPFAAGRYHSWVCDPAYLPETINITAWDEDGEVMACRHKVHPAYGVQFHPESFLTPEGNRIIKNFVEL